MSKTFINKRIQSNLLQQNCFVRDVCVASDLQHISSDKFCSIDEKVDDKGVHIEINEYPYPITPDYVNSFVDSSDYRLDPFNAIVNSSKRNNLGDIRAAQEIASMDSEQARSLYKQLSEKFSVSSAASAAPAAPAAPAASSEVK